MVNFIKRVIILCGKRTTIRLTEFEWQTLENICRHENIRRNKLLNLIKDNKSAKLGLTYAVRLFMLIYANKNISPFLCIHNPETLQLASLLNSIR